MLVHLTLANIVIEHLVCNVNVPAADRICDRHNARRAAAAGVMIAVSTDSHSTREFDLIRCGLDQARRARLARDSILNCQTWKMLSRLFVR